MKLPWSKYKRKIRRNRNIIKEIMSDYRVIKAEREEFNKAWYQMIPKEWREAAE